MTETTARLVTKAELLRRVERSRTRLYEDASAKGVLRNALTSDGRIDLNHIDAINYCHQYNYKEPDVKAEVAKALAAEREKVNAPKAGPTQAVDVHPNLAADAAVEEYDDNDEKSPDEFMNMTLNELVKRFGTQAKFYDYARARKTLSDIQAKDEDAARRRGEHVPFSIVLSLVGQIDALQAALLSETAVAIRTKITALVKSGAEEKQIEKAAHDLISRTIKTTKANTERMIRDVQRK
ncbi:hypothetical protein [Vibrio phage VP16T]|nr:hypothetical protein [Vibrio phage VP16T]